MAEQHAWMLNDRQRKRALNIIVVTQCLGMLTAFLFQNGFYLNYFDKLGFSSSAFAMLASIPFWLAVFLLLPCAYYSDRFGKLKLSLFGQVLIVVSLVLMLAAGWAGGSEAIVLVVLSLVVFGVGGSLQGASWFALLGAIIPPHIRGRFFGRLRVTFTLVNILFAWAVARVMVATPSVRAFQGLLLFILLAHVARYFTYARIPELEVVDGESHKRQSFWTACRRVFEVEGFAGFNGYVLLMTLFTTGVPLVFGLMQKDVFAFSESRIMVIGGFFLAGTMVGCGLGGPMVDRFGTKWVFLITHVAYAFVMIAMLARHWVPWSLETHATLCAFAHSMTGGIAGVAISSEAIALIPATNKSLSTAVHMTLFNAGIGLSAGVVSICIGMKVLAGEWDALGHTFTEYDTLLIGFAVMVILMLAAIGLVPKVVKKASLLPGSGLPRA